MNIVLQTHAVDPAFALRNCRRPDAQTFECELCVRSAGFLVERVFYFEEPDFSRFCDQLVKMDRTLSGIAELQTRYEENGFRFEVHATGTVIVSGTVREYGAMDQFLRFSFITDQTVLTPFSRDLAQLLLLQPPNDH